jgi:CHAT domain-containing protein
MASRPAHPPVAASNVNDVGDEALARAWALKATCYEAWHSEPQRTRDAANALAGLANGSRNATVVALACWTEGIALLAEGRLADGLAQLKRAQVRFFEQGDVLHAAQTQVPQMVALSFLGREAEVVDVGRQALEIFQASGDVRSAGKIEVNLGTSFSRQNRYAEAEFMYRRAAERFANLNDVELSLMAQIGLANALTWQFRLDEALSAAVQARQEACSSGHAILHAQTLEAIGLVELNRGRWGEALSALAHSLQILGDVGASPQRRLESEIALADAYAAVNLLDEALRLYQRIIDEAHALPDPNEEAVATLQHARVMARRGNYSEALSGLVAARKQYIALDNSPALALTELCEARVELALNHPTQALRIATHASELLRDSGIRGWWYEARLLQAAALAGSGSLALARSMYESVAVEASDLRQVAFDCHAGLGKVLLAQHEVDAARRQFELALQSVDAEREALPADELRSAIGVEAAEVHDALIRISLARGDAAEVLTNVERGRARALAHGLADAVGAPPTTHTSGRLSWLRRRWREAIRDDDRTGLASLTREIHDIENTLLEEQRRADLRQAKGTRRDILHPAPEALDIPLLQSRLGPARGLVMYHRHGTTWVAIVVTAQALTLQSLPATDVGERVAGLRLQIESMRNPIVAQRHGPLVMQRLLDHARALHEQLWLPIETLLEGCTEVVIVPHGALHDLPFGLLHDGSRWLVQRYALSASLSVGLWLSLTRGSAWDGAHRILAVGTPGPALPHVEREIAGLSALFGSTLTALSGAAATAASVRLAAEDQVSVMHFACHARFRADNPAFSYLMLVDGPLPLYELARWKLRAPLVVLSACNTGVSRVAPGDEALGLVRAVLLAGAGSVVASQWAVDDSATADLIHHFYLNLHAGDRPSVALQRAQSDAAQRGLHPYFWGAFALHGGG